jgi:hypothetical protein
VQQAVCAAETGEWDTLSLLGTCKRIVAFCPSIIVDGEGLANFSAAGWNFTTTAGAGRVIECADTRAYANCEVSTQPHDVLRSAQRIFINVANCL